MGDAQEEKAKINGPEKSEKDVEHGEDEKPYPLVCSYRLFLAILAFFCFIHNYSQRMGMSVAIVCMVNHTAIELMDTPSNDTRNITNLACVKDTAGANATGSSEDGPFVWEKDVQGHILGSFFYGYLISQIPGGMLAEKFGGKWVFAANLAISTIGTLLTPIAAKTSFGFLLFLRVLVGVGSGAMFPAMHAMWGQWAPPYERSRLAGISYAGAMMGSVVSLPLSGILCQYGFDGGWPSIFYVIGASSLVMLVLWILFTSNTPSSHGRISSGERNYIVKSLKGQLSEDSATNWCSVPWLKIVMSGPVWAIIIANFCSDWGLYTLLTNIPTFYKEVLLFDISSNGLYSALPFIGLWANMNISPIIIDKLRAKGVFSTTVGRKIFNSVGLLGAGLFLIGLSFMDCTQTVLAVVLLIIAVTISGTAYSGFLVNHMDIAPKYAGTLFGISNGLASCSGFIAPPVASALTRDRSRESWQIVFFVAAAVYAFGALFYIIFGSGELQTWAVDKEAAMAPEVVELKSQEKKTEENPEA